MKRLQSVTSVKTEQLVVKTPGAGRIIFKKPTVASLLLYL
jgi:hypothetical protein